MAATYLGETPVSPAEYQDYKPADWALVWIERYGMIDGDHHKQWLVDQIARILHGAPVIITEARWTDHAPELRFRLGGAPLDYHEWVGGELGGDWSTGIAP